MEKNAHCDIGWWLVDDIVSQISAISKNNPKKIAVHYKDDSITYENLIEQTTLLANHLYQKGVRAGHAVAIYMRPGIQRIVAMLAVIKHGAAYVPLDPIQPLERRNYICQHADIQFILVDQVNEDTPSGRTIIVKRHQDKIDCEAMTFPAVDCENLCYIIYTSGTTGKPKAVCITQKNVILYSKNQYCVRVHEDHVFAHASNFAFDPTILEVFVPLLNGATIVILEKYIITMPQELNRLIKHFKINFMWFTCSVFNYLLDNGFVDFRLLDYVIIGGEPVSFKHVKKLIDSGMKPNHLINGYGPTETTVLSFYYDIQTIQKNQKTISIGKPLDKEQAAVLLANGELACAGDPGELYILGEQIGKGYLNLDPMQENGYTTLKINHQIVRAYKTGDIVKFDEQGFFYFLGRVDDQIKMNGFRVDPSEIIYCIEENPCVKKALIKDYPDSEGKHRLVAYVALNNDEFQKTEAWRVVYDNIYLENQPANPRENFSGWKNSFTRENYSTAEMRVWLQATIDNLQQIPFKQVLEIGCGTGLILFKILEKCDHYTGIDFSAPALENILSILQQDSADLDKVTLLKCEADKLDQIFQPSQKFDLIILNSVVQYFPNIDYFEKVLNQAKSFLTQDGVIYLGDIRNLTLLPAFYAKKYAYEQQIQKAFEQEKELCFAPAYFKNAGFDFYAVKKRTYLEPSELSVFRYDVYLSNHLIFPIENIEHEGALFNKVSSFQSIISEKDIHRTLKAKLPHYMLPERIVILPEMATNTNCKYDLSKLPNPFLESDTKSQVVEKLELTEIIYRISQYKIHSIDLNDNLVEAGLDSLDFLKLIALVEDNFNVRLSLTQIFSAGSINEIEKLINQLQAIEMEPNEFAVLSQLPLLPNQIEKWYEHNNPHLKNVNNLVYAIRYESGFQLEKMVNAINHIYRSFSALRVSVYSENNVLLQRIAPVFECDIKLIQANNMQDFHLLLSKETKRLQEQTVSLEHDPLFRCVIIQFDTAANLLIYFHHIILDLQSLDLVITNLNASYLGRLSIIEDNYQQFISDQIRHISTIEYQHKIQAIAKTFYKKKRELIVDNYQLQDYTGDYIRIPIPNELVMGVKNLAKSAKVSNFTCYFTVLQLTLQAVFQQDFFTIGITSSIRLQAHMQKTVGLINNYLIIPAVENNQRALESVHQSMLTVFEQIHLSNYDIQLELNRLGDDGKLFNLFFDYNKVSNAQSRADINILGLQPSNIVNRIISVRVTESADDAILSIRFRKNIISRKKIEEISTQYFTELNKIIKVNELC